MSAFDDGPGFAVSPQGLSEADVSRLRAAVDGVPTRSRAGVRHLMSNPVVAELASDSRLLALVRPALGMGASPFRATLFDKSAASNWLVVWHQDTALPLRVRRDRAGWGPWSTKGGVLYAHAPASALERVIALRVHLDDSTPGNGPLRVLAGTHRMGVLSDGAIQKLARERRPIECTVPRGGVVSMRPLLVHASSKATERARRRVLHIEYAASLRLEQDLELDVA